MGFLKRREPEGRMAPGEGVVLGSPEELERFAALLEFLGDATWPDGETRETGTLLIFLDEGRLKACLSDRAQSLVAFVSGAGLSDLLDSIEEDLRSDGLDWRAMRKGKRR